MPLEYTGKLGSDTGVSASAARQVVGRGRLHQGRVERAADVEHARAGVGLVAGERRRPR